MLASLGIPFTAGQVFLGLLATVLFALVGFGVMTLLTSYLRFQAMARGVRSGGDGEGSPQGREAFEIRIAAEIASVSKSEQPFCIFLVEPCYEGGIAVDEDLSRRVQASLVKLLRESLRADDQVLPFHAHLVGLLVQAEPVHREALAARLTQRVRQAVQDDSELPLTGCRIGCAAWPAHARRMRPLVDTAEHALGLAPSRGIHTFHLGPGIEEDERGLQKDAAVDPETGLVRADQAGRSLQRYVAGFRRERRPVSLLYLDIDFKDRYYMHYSREGVRDVERQVAAILLGNLRGDDLACHHPEGGFIVAVGVGRDEAEQIGHRLEEAVGRHRFLVKTSQLKVSISIGLAVCPDHGRLPAQLLHGAEAAFKAAVHHGGAVVMVYDPQTQRTRSGDKPVDAF